MRTQSIVGRRARWLIACLMIGLSAVGTAFASITPAQQAKVVMGTSMDEVRQILGQPARVLRARHSAGPTWIYDLNDGTRHKAYELDFDAAGKVEWIEVHDYNID